MTAPQPKPLDELFDKWYIEPRFPDYRTGREVWALVKPVLEAAEAWSQPTIDEELLESREDKLFIELMELRKAMEGK